MDRRILDLVQEVLNRILQDLRFLSWCCWGSGLLGCEAVVTWQWHILEDQNPQK